MARIEAGDPGADDLYVYVWTGERMEYLPARAVDTDEKWVDIWVRSWRSFDGTRLLQIDGEAVTARINNVNLYLFNKRTGVVTRPDGTAIVPESHDPNNHISEARL